MKIYRIYDDSEERYYSDVEERLYSTGDSELDELMERAFCEGYEYAQKEFGLLEDFANMSPEEVKSRVGQIRKKAGGVASEIGNRGKATYEAQRDVADKIAKEFGNLGKGTRKVITAASEYIPTAQKHAGQLSQWAKNKASEYQKWGDEMNRKYGRVLKK